MLACVCVIIFVRGVKHLGVDKQLWFNDVNSQQDATTFSFINLFKSALHFSGDKFAHPQGHFVTIYSLWYNAPTLLPTGATVEMELKFHSFVSATYSQRGLQATLGVGS